MAVLRFVVPAFSDARALRVFLRYASATVRHLFDVFVRRVGAPFRGEGPEMKHRDPLMRVIFRVPPKKLGTFVEKLFSLFLLFHRKWISGEELKVLLKNNDNVINTEDNSYVS